MLGFLPELTGSDLEALAAPGIVPERLRKYLEAEVQRRITAGNKTAGRAESSEGCVRLKTLKQRNGQWRH